MQRKETIIIIGVVLVSFFLFTKGLPSSGKAIAGKEWITHPAAYQDSDSYTPIEPQGGSCFI